MDSGNKRLKFDEGDDPDQTEQATAVADRMEEKENHIILMTVYNPAYPIDCDVVCRICKPYGPVLRVVIFKKNAVQAMVEFDSVVAARKARHMLDGRDIYTGCCTLNVKFAKTSHLNVRKNDVNRGYDYTKFCDNRPPLLPDSWAVTSKVNSNVPPSIAAGDRCNSILRGARYPLSHLTNPFARDHPSQLNFNQFIPVIPSNMHVSVRGSVSTTCMLQQNSVMMVYGLELEKVNCDLLFNLFCLYGNVVKVKFLKTKQGCAMVQMGDTASIERCINILNNVTIFGNLVQMSVSKQAFLNNVQQPYQLPDGSPSFKDFSGNKNNRYNPGSASKNRADPPIDLLRFYNLAKAITKEEIIDLFKINDAPQPIDAKFFPSRTETSSSGLIKFDNVDDAVGGLVICNHLPLTLPTGKVSLLRLCFASGSQF